MNELLCLAPEVHQQTRGLVGAGGPQERQAVENPDGDQRPLQRLTPNARCLPIRLGRFEHHHRAIRHGGERCRLAKQPPIDQRRREVRRRLSLHEHATLNTIVANSETGDLDGGTPSRRQRRRDTTRLLAVIDYDMDGLSLNVHGAYARCRTYADDHRDEEVGKAARIGPDTGHVDGRVSSPQAVERTFVSRWPCSVHSFAACRRGPSGRTAVGAVVYQAVNRLSHLEQDHLPRGLTPGARCGSLMSRLPRVGHETHGDNAHHKEARHVGP